MIQLEERTYPVPRGRSGMSKIEREPAKRIPAQYEVKLHTRFTFKIDSPLRGILSVLQWSMGVWWPIPLSDFGCWTSVESGTQWRPYDPEEDLGDLPHLLSEHTETGLHRLVFIVSGVVHPRLKNADPEQRLEPNHLNEIAEAYRASPKDSWQMFRLNVLVKALDAP